MFVCLLCLFARACVYVCVIVCVLWDRCCTCTCKKTPLTHVGNEQHSNDEKRGHLASERVHNSTKRIPHCKQETWYNTDDPDNDDEGDSNNRDDDGDDDEHGNDGGCGCCKDGDDGD